MGERERERERERRREKSNVEVKGSGLFYYNFLVQMLLKMLFATVVPAKNCTLQNKLYNLLLNGN